MRPNVYKTIFFGAILGAIIGVVVWHPGFFVSGGSSFADESAAAGAASSSAAGQPPLFVLPTLTANAGSQPIVAATSSASTPPSVGAEVEAIADITSGHYFLNVNGAERWPMASLSKLMTAVVATDVLNPNDRITITQQMVAVDPTQQILHVGDTYTVAQMLYVMLLPSNNVAAEAFAEYYGRAQFLTAMNTKAQQWGMTSTYYDDPSGLSAANESNASDLLKLAQNIYAQYPQIFAITRTPEYTAQNLATGQSVIIKSINQFAGTANFIGGKTGYTDQADGNLLSVFNDKGEPIFVLVLGIDDGVRFNGTQELYDWFLRNF